jgi:membrane protease YdiL (CAAX protease family)
MTVPPAGQEPPPIALPPPRLLPERRRSGWIGLLVIFSLMIIGQLVDYFAPRKESGEQAFAAQEFSLEFIVLSKSIGVGQSDLGQRRQLEDALYDIVAKVDSQRKTNRTAARLYAAARTELGKPLEPGDLEVFRKKDDPSDRALAEIYGAKNLSREQAEEALRAIPGQGFLDRIARAHAMEKAGMPEARKGLVQPRKLVGMGLIGATVCVGAPAGIVLGLVYLNRRRRGLWTPEGPPAVLISPLDADRLAIRGALMMLAFLLVPIVLMPLSPVIDESLMQVLFGILVCACFVDILGRKVLGYAGSWRDILGRSKPFSRLVLWGFCGWIANMPFLLFGIMLSAVLTQFLPEPTHPATDMLASGSLANVILLFVAAVILAPVLEEFLFRGVLFPASRWLLASTSGGILLSSFLFAGIHPQGIAGWPPLFAVAAMAAFLTYQTRSLVPAIVLHALHNLATLLIGLTFL